MQKSYELTANMQNVKSYCDKNEDFAKLMALFTDGYMAVYNKRKVKQREMVQPFLNRNFFTWYYSDVNYECDISPACFIGSHIYHKFGEDFTVVPIPVPEYKKSKLLGISYSFHVFTLENHPLFSDFEELLDSARKTGKPADFDFAFGNRHYISFIAAICDEDELLNAKAERLFVNEKKFAAYDRLQAKEKLHKLLSLHLAFFLKQMKRQNVPGKLPSLAKLMKLMSAGHDYDSFIEKSFPGLMTSTMKFLETVDIDDFEDIEDMELKLEELGELMGKSLDIQMMLALMSSALFVSCGLYFQIIQPEYSCFEYNELDDAYLDTILNAEPESHGIDKVSYAAMMSYMFYFKPANSYCLTPIGAKLFGKNYVDEEGHGLIAADDYDTALEEMLLERDDFFIDPGFEKYLEMFQDGFLSEGLPEKNPKKGKILQFPEV